VLASVQFNVLYLGLDYHQAKSAVGENGCFRLLYDSFHHSTQVEDLQREPHSFIFTGNLKTFQNKHNLQRFLHEIWLPLLERDKRWKLYITGNKPGVAETLLKVDFQANNIVNMGFVDDIEHAIARKKYFISPTYIGSGIRIKVLNALSLGAVCFVSPLDYSMLHVLKDDYNLLKYSSFDDFYTKLANLELDEGLYTSISLHARQIGTNFTWTYYAEKVKNEISNVPCFTSR
jgi:polysaccharide biosynthesis protein PslH